MDSKFAKDVFMALAKKLSFSSIVRITNSNNSNWKLVFTSPSHGSSAVLGVQVDEFWPLIMWFKSHSWEDMLQELEGKTIAIGSERIPVNSIEQLVVELELEGFLDIA